MKRVPSIIYNNSDYIYPNGLKVYDEQELDNKLANGWDTGAVDKFKNPAKKIEATKPVHLWKNDELKAALGLPADDKTKRSDLIKALKAKG